jgi:hypothetical protein
MGGGARRGIHSRVQVGEGDADERAPADFRILPGYSKRIQMPETKNRNRYFLSLQIFCKI